MTKTQQTTPKRASKKPLKTPPSATAIHAKNATGGHAVGIWDLHVYIVPDGDAWFAQGLEIDYGVQGDSVEEAKTNFEIGLEGTIDLHLRVDGKIDNLLKFAPMEIIHEVWKNRLNGSIERYSQVSLHDLGRVTSSLPFDGISYLVAGAGAAQ